MDQWTREELATYFEKEIGYDPFEDDPTITEDAVREILRYYLAAV